MKRIDVAMAEAVLVPHSADLGWDYTEETIALAEKMVAGQATESEVSDFWQGVWDTQDEFIPAEQEEVDNEHEAT